ncbi:MAG: hypothetical protein JXA78_15170, partial [Anaerolineales bacterium]|nr:hypothetical protein [Anaerolineales bacterium]
LLSGVTVYLCTTTPCNDTSETMSVTTNVDGFYSFGGLNVNSTYYVAVDNSDVPSYLAQTYEPNNNGAGDDNSAVDNTVAVYINASGAVSSINGVACTDCNLDVDYGYRLTDGTNSVSGTIFFDSNQNGGIYNNGGGALDYPLQDVTVSLWMLDCGADSTCGTADDGPSTLVTATQTTTAGAYSFSNLPNGDYRIVVDTPSAQLSDMTQTSEPDDSLCTDAGSNCNNLHILELSGNQTIEDKDWGFYAEMDCGDLPASYNRTILADEGPCHILGNIQLGANWDAETNGFITDSIAQGDDVNQPTSVDDEDGISFLNPSTWTAGGAGTIRISSVVGDNAYLVGWFDWNRDNDFFDASTGKWDAGEYIYFGHIPAGNNIDKSVPIPSSASLPNSINMRFRLYEGASPPPLISPGGVVQNGEVEDYQEPLGPTAVTMGQYGAISGVGQVTIYWETALELDAIGFNLFRATDPDGERVQLNPELIPSQAFGGLMGAYYEFIDYDVQAGQTYYYWLEFIDFEGKTVFGPMAGYGGYGIYLPLVTR